MTEPTPLQTLTEIINQLPDEDRIQVEQCAIKIRSACQEHGAAGVVAVALVGAEMDAGA